MQKIKWSGGLGCVLVLSSSHAFAWDPNEGATPIPAPKAAPVSYTASPSPAPLRFEKPVTVIAPPPPAAPVAMAPALTPPPPAMITPVPVAYSAPVYAPATGMQSAEEQTAVSRYKANRFKLGVEGFYDRYQERSVDLDSRAQYGSVTGDYTHYFSPDWFSEIDGRVSYGHDHYHSISGTIDGVPQWEYEARLLVGRDFNYRGDEHFKPYIGLGTRYYVDEGKGEVTNTGFYGYDRRIFQLYMPVGFIYDFTALGLQWTPKLEYDPMLYGHVNSRLQNLGYYELDNNQRSGSGWRGEVMFGQVNEQGVGWQFGPFVRYWNVPDSKTYVDPNGVGWIEPHNSRWQTGAALRFLF